AAAAPQRGHLATVGDALVSGNDDDAASCEFVLYPIRTHFDDARIDVAVVGDDARLATGEADSVAPALANRHRQQCHRDTFAGGEQHVELTPLGIHRDLLGER